MRTSPTEKTFASGPSDSGTANTSPSHASAGACTAAELANAPGVSAARPAAASAPGSAGITPPLARIATAFISPPSPTIHTPGSRRLSHRKPASSP